MVAFDGNNLVIEGAQLQAEAAPSIEVVGHGDSTARALGAADRPELGECRSTKNGRLVHTLAGVDVIGVAIGCDGSLLGGASTGVVCAEIFNDVVLDQRVGLESTKVNYRGDQETSLQTYRPAVDSKVAVAIWLISAGVGNCPTSNGN